MVLLAAVPCTGVASQPFPPLWLSAMASSGLGGAGRAQLCVSRCLTKGGSGAERLHPMNLCPALSGVQQGEPNSLCQPAVPSWPCQLQALRELTGFTCPKGAHSVHLLQNTDLFLLPQQVWWRRRRKRPDCHLSNSPSTASSRYVVVHKPGRTGYRGCSCSFPTGHSRERFP